MNHNRSNRWPLRTARPATLVLAIAAIAAMAGCGAPGPLMPEQRASSTAESRPPPAPEAYKVRSGDTLYSIAFGYGLDWRRVARWNNIGVPYTIHAGDWLRMQPPPDMRPAVAATPGPGTANQTGPGPEGGAGGGSESKPAPSRPVDKPATRSSEEVSPGALAGSAAPSASSRRKPASDSAPVPGAATRSAAGVVWRWPTEGEVARGFNSGASRKGILIAGERGQPIRAAADGEVVYSGNGLIGYGELIIVKHSDRMLSAYAHNRERLIGEGARVRSGQLIARMGSNERDEFVLHFEIRRDGKPDNPVKYLPAR